LKSVVQNLLRVKLLSGMANGQNPDDLRGDSVEDSEAFVLDLSDLLPTYFGNNPALLWEGYEPPNAFEQTVEPSSRHSRTPLGSDEIQCLLSLIQRNG
jgi:hypothetical protein